VVFGGLFLFMVKKIDEIAEIAEWLLSECENADCMRDCLMLRISLVPPTLPAA
jgi:hypothetical protein